MAEEDKSQFTTREALFYHQTIRPGKVEIIPSKPVATQRDLSLAYSPGVAAPVEAIAKDPSKAALYTGAGSSFWTTGSWTWAGQSHRFWAGPPGDGPRPSNSRSLTRSSP